MPEVSATGNVPEWYANDDSRSRSSGCGLDVSPRALVGVRQPYAVSVHRRPRQRVVFPLVVIVAIVVIWLLPGASADPTDIGLSPVDAYRGTVESIEPFEPDPDDLNAPIEGEVWVKLTEGPQAGESVRAFVTLPYTSAAATDFEPGDEVVVTFTKDFDGQAFVGISERWRLPAVLALVVVFALVIIAIGGWQGARALLSLLLTIVVVIKILVPALLEGVAPVPLAIGISLLVTIVSIILTEGASRWSLAAILGTVGGLAATAAISIGFGEWSGITGTGAGDLFFVQLPSGEGLDTRGILMAAIIIGAVGVLDDMTVTQAATVEQLTGHGVVSRRDVWWRSLRVGRSHIAATVNTLFLAYVGASLPALILLVLIAEPPLLTLNRELLALEIVRTLAGSLGIILAMPFTTAAAVMLARRGQSRPVRAAPAG
jgi:uncharacterized membrane protein